ncbi:MAG: pirin family protein [Proteobacteria bacterium]|nr:pirin family protein [Pseudomonadota bacterium]
MLTLRPAAERGHGRHGWLDSRHTFSFADYVDPRQMGFRALRVINEDRVQPGRGFGTHHHEDMEIITVVLEGALSHQDSLGNGATIRPGEVQRMSAGTGIDHSEFNHASDAVVHFLQIWIVPERRGLAPAYEQRAFPLAKTGSELLLVASRDGRAGTVTVHQDVAIFEGRLAAGARVEHALSAGRHAWLQVARGAALVNGQRVAAGDGLAASDEARLAITADTDCELLLFDLG